MWAMDYTDGATKILLPLLVAAAAYVAGRRSRSISVATTVEKAWLDTVALDLAEFIELQCDSVWHRWRLRHYELSRLDQMSSPTYDEHARRLEDAAWQRSFRAALLQTKLLLLLDDQDQLQRRLMTLIDEYAAIAEEQTCADNNGDLEKIYAVATQLHIRLEEQHKSGLLEAGRRVLKQKRKDIRSSV